MRTARTIADGVGYNHVILKATGPQFLFREDADKAAFQISRVCPRSVPHTPQPRRAGPRKSGGYFDFCE